MSQSLANLAETSVFDDVRDQLALVCALESQRIRPEALLVEYGLDSLRCMDLVIALEQRFGIGIPDSDLCRLKSVGDVVRVIEAKLCF